MNSCRLNQYLLAAGLFTLALPAVSAQQVTYYDFNAPQANSGQVSYNCSTATLGTPASPLFCFNYSSPYGYPYPVENSPSFVFDTYPPSIDPNANTDNDSGSSAYATLMSDPVGGQDASMWFSIPQDVADGFTAWFAFKLTPTPNSNTTADGIAFVIQNSAGGQTDPATGCIGQGSGPTALGGINYAGGCIGYAGIDNSLALEFDTYQNSWDSNNNHIALQDCGAGLPNSASHEGSCLVSLGGPNNTSISTLITSPETSVAPPAAPVGVTLTDGNVHQVVVDYTNGVLSVYLDPAFVPGTHTPVAGSVPVFSGTYNLATALNLINGTNAYVGFTAATGEFFESQELMAWTFTPHSVATQQQPLNTQGNPTLFPYGTHTYAVTYPQAVVPPAILMTVSASTLSPAQFSALIANTPFAGSQCQVYDDTGGNCVIYSVSCSQAGASIACPAPPQTEPPFDCAANPQNTTNCIQIVTSYSNSTQPVSPGFLQGDPLYSAITQITASGGTATVTCTGECAVYGPPAQPTGQQVTVLQPDSPFSGGGSGTQITVQTVLAPNQFTFATDPGLSGTWTGGYLTSNNVQNIFTSYTPQDLDGSHAGSTPTFSDFVALSVTTIGSQILFNPTGTLPVDQPYTFTASVNTSATLLPAPSPGNTLAGTVTFVTGPSGSQTTLCTATAPFPSVTSNGVTTWSASCSFTPQTPGSLPVTAIYSGDSYHQGSSVGPISLTVSTITPALTFAPAPSSQTYGTPISLAALDATAMYSGSAVPGTFAYTTTIGGVPNQPVIGGVTVLPAGTYLVNATFTPSTPGEYSTASATASYTVYQATPVLSWTPAPLQLGNPLTAAQLDATASFNGAPVPGSYKYTPPLNTPISSTAQQLSVLFTPNDTNDYASVSDSVPLTVTAGPLASISVPSVDFGTVYLGTINLKTVTVSNIGSASMSLTDPLLAIVQGGDSDEFVLLNLCPHSLAAGKSCTMILTFIAGPFYNQQTATLSINDNAPGSPQTVALSALVIDPVAQLNAASLNFGTQKAKTSGAPQSVTLTNTGATTLTIGNVALAGADPSDFTMTNNCPSSLGPKGACTIKVAFSPAVTGSLSAALVITDNAQNSPQSIPLTGKGD